jgi:hypothetical protein
MGRKPLEEDAGQGGREAGRQRVRGGREGCWTQPHQIIEPIGRRLHD